MKVSMSCREPTPPSPCAIADNRRIACGRDNGPTGRKSQAGTEWGRPPAMCLASEKHASTMPSQSRRAASIAAMSIFFICIIASNARFAAAGSGSVIALVRAIGVICQDNPHLSLHQPHALS